jgi:hypothetical protein
MTPKEKAWDLNQKFMELQHYLENNAWNNSKQCALIAVNQLIEYQDYFMDYVRIDLPSHLIAGLPYKYWDKVKQEIEKL